MFTLQVSPDHLEEYRRRHAAVWPEMLAALREAGWHRYTLHLRGDGLVVGVVEADDLAAARAAMAATGVDARWQAEMAPLMVEPRPDRHDPVLQVLPQIFDIDEPAPSGAEEDSP